MSLRMDGSSARIVQFDTQKFRQFDHGYAVTSYSSQGLTASRVLVHIDTDLPRSLINNRLAYVSISRASLDAHIYTNEAETLGSRLESDVTKTAALDRQRSHAVSDLSATIRLPSARPDSARIEMESPGISL